MGPGALLCIQGLRKRACPPPARAEPTLQALGAHTHTSTQVGAACVEVEQHTQLRCEIVNGKMVAFIQAVRAADGGRAQCITATCLMQRRAGCGS